MAHPPPVLRSRLFSALLLGAWACTAPQPRPGPERETGLDGAALGYLDVGSGSDTLIFVHGWCCDRTVWHKQLPPPAGRRYLLLDLPGHGASAPPEQALSVELYARAVAAALDDAGVERAVLVGHSNGTPVVREFARRFPQRARGLVIVDGALKPFFDDPAAGERFVAPMEAPDYREQVGRAFVDPMLAPVLADGDRAALRELMLSAGRRAMVEGFRAVLDPTIWGDDPIAVPTLALMVRQPAWDDAYRAYVRELVPRLVWRDFEGISHFLMIDDPVGFERELASFLATLAP